MPEIWRGECKMLPGGFQPAENFATGTVLKRGTLLYVDFAAMKAYLCKAAKIVAIDTSLKSVTIAKGAHFSVGDYIMKVGANTNSPKVDAVDTTSSDTYDILTLSAALTGGAEGNVICQCNQYVAAAAGPPVVTEVKSSPLYTPNAIVGADAEFTGRGLPTIDAAYEAVVLLPNVGYAILDDWKQGIALKHNPNIIFIHQ